MSYPSHVFPVDFSPQRIKWNIYGINLTGSIGHTHAINAELLLCSTASKIKRKYWKTAISWVFNGCVWETEITSFSSARNNKAEEHTRNRHIKQDNSSPSVLEV